MPELIIAKTVQHPSMTEKIFTIKFKTCTVETFRFFQNLTSKQDHPARTIHQLSRIIQNHTQSIQIYRA